MGIWEIRTAVGKKYRPVLPIHLFISSHFHMHKLSPTEGPTFESTYYKWFLTWGETRHRTTVCEQDPTTGCQRRQHDVQTAQQDTQTDSGLTEVSVWVRVSGQESEGNLPDLWPALPFLTQMSSWTPQFRSPPGNTMQFQWTTVMSKDKQENTLKHEYTHLTQGDNNNVVCVGG